ncbi:MAG: dienelactone hydrolase family protein [Candidatus Hydrogenedentes bacterium]|nr:dienelactone hydrolase family protein [Candidatus Hydrogenedentota bacterium]
MVDLSKMKGLVGWSQTRSEIEQAVTSVIGKVPEERVELQVKTVDEQEFPGYTRKRVNYFVDSWDRVSAWLFIPDGKDEVPAVICCHQECRQGKDEPAGLEGDPRLAFAQHYAELGFVAVAPDCITAGERLSKHGPLDTKGFYKDKISEKLSAAGKMILDHMRAVDLLEEQKRVDAARIGVIGHGLGAMNALLLTAFDERVRACVASCGFTRHEGATPMAHWVNNPDLVLMPKLCEDPSGTPPFDWEHLLALAAPSPTLVITALKETPFPNPKSCDKAVQLASRIYKLLGAPGALEHFGHSNGYEMSTECLDRADEWFERWL